MLASVKIYIHKLSSTWSVYCSQCFQYYFQENCQFGLVKMRNWQVSNTICLHFTTVSLKFIFKNFHHLSFCLLHEVCTAVSAFNIFHVLQYLLFNKQYFFIKIWTIFMNILFNTLLKGVWYIMYVYHSDLSRYVSNCTVIISIIV
jgi:hypothetical protein